MEGEAQGTGTHPAPGTEPPRPVGSRAAVQMGRLEDMQSRRTKGDATVATRTRRVSLDLTDTQDVLDLKMLEALEAIERVRSKALSAVGSMLTGDR